MAMGSHQSARMGTSTWLTPPGIVEALGPFDLDPCTPEVMPWSTADRRYTEVDDGLARPWRGRVWLNPPYGREADVWLARMVDHGRGTALVFARTETAAFFRYLWGAAGALLFIEGRLHFHHADGERAKANAGAPSVLAAYGADDVDRLAESGINGAFVPLARSGQVVFVVRHGADVTWCDLIRELVDRQGGTITLDVAYMLVGSHPKAAANKNWRAKVRQTIQRIGMARVGPATYGRTG